MDYAYKPQLTAKFCLRFEKIEKLSMQNAINDGPSTHQLYILKHQLLRLDVLFRNIKYSA